MKFILILLAFFTLHQLNGQIYLDDTKPRLIIECSNDSIKNDSLYKHISDYKDYKEIYIMLDSGVASLDLAILKNAESATIVGNGFYNIIYSGTDGLLNLRKIEIRTKLINIDFGSGLLGLEKLIIVYSGLSEIPKTINRCTNLIYLDLSYNDISSFHSELNNLLKLKELAVESNKLSELPCELSKNTELRSVNFGFNQFVKFPKVLFKLPNLKVVSLMANEIPDLPYEKLKKKEIKLYY
jgi:Leucine-rich repeat (LRR) protein